MNCLSCEHVLAFLRRFSVFLCGTFEVGFIKSLQGITVVNLGMGDVSNDQSDEPKKRFQVSGFKLGVVVALARCRVPGSFVRRASFYHRAEGASGVTALRACAAPASSAISRV